MEKEIILTIKRLYEIYDEEQMFNEGRLTDFDVLYIIETLIKALEWKESNDNE